MTRVSVSHIKESCRLGAEHPSGTKLVVAKFFCDNFTQNHSRNLWEFQWKFRDSESMSFAKPFFNVLHKVISHYRWPSLTPSSCMSVLPSQNFLHHSLTYVSLIKFGPHAALIWRWISAVLWPSACKKGSLRESHTWRQLSLMWGYVNLSYTMTSASIQRVITSRSSLCM
jgi:hypothetical protein